MYIRPQTQANIFICYLLDHVYQAPFANMKIERRGWPVLYSLGSQAGVVDINHAFHLYYNIVCGSSCSRSLPDFEGFLRALRFPPSAKLIPSVIQYAGPH